MHKDKDSGFAEQTLLFTDVVDSTAWVERLGDAQSAERWAEHDRLARTLLAAHGGREIDRSDGFFVIFDDTAAAARFALGYHDACAAIGLTTRVGLHRAAVTLRSNSADDVARGAKPIEVDGLAKPFAARLMSLAAGGQTLLSASARAALGAETFAGCTMVSHGHYRLKGVTEPVEVFEVGRAGTSAFVPPPDSTKAWRVVREGDLWLPLREVRHNLAPERDAFVGRRNELRQLAQRLDGGARLVTLLGVGGTGKTRLARRFGLGWLGDWPGGVFFCDLSEARTLDGILFAVAMALAVPLAKDDPVAQLGHAIAGRGKCLLIFDNFEQVVDNAPATVGRWLDRAADASFIVTSRALLHLPGEIVLPVEPLELATEAVQLFAVRARALQPAFALDVANHTAVAEITRLLDGLPLAIELAATRITLLSPAQIVQRLNDRFAVLTGAGGAVSRQATLRAAIDWSWRLLAPWEQAALAQCSVFEGGFSLAACEAVIDLSNWPDAPPVMDVVQSLLEKSLLRSLHTASGARLAIDETYYGMYLSIHEYASQQLALAPAPASARALQRHGDCFAARGCDEAIDALSSAGGASLRRLQSLDLDNFIAACRRAIERLDALTAVRTYRAAWSVLELQGPIGVALELGAQLERLDIGPFELQSAALLTRALAADASGARELALRCATRLLELAQAQGDLRGQGRALSLLGELGREHGDADSARERLETALRYQRSAADRPGECLTLLRLGNLASDGGGASQARRYFESALALAINRGDLRMQAGVLGNIGKTYYFTGHLDEARDFVERALAVCREAGDRRYESALAINLGVLQLDRGEPAAAREALEAALAVQREIGHRRGEATALANLGILHIKQGEPERAAMRLEQSLSISRELGDKPDEGEALGLLAGVQRTAGRHHEACAIYAAALAIHREVGNRRLEGTSLGELGAALAESGRCHEAIPRLEEAISIHREVDNPQEEGIHLGDLGAALADAGLDTRAADALAQGERILRGLHHPFELGKLLCQRARLQALRGDRAAARMALDEVTSIAATLSTGTSSELGQWIERLKRSLTPH